MRAGSKLPYLPILVAHGSAEAEPNPLLAFTYECDTLGGYTQRATTTYKQGNDLIKLANDAHKLVLSLETTWVIIRVRVLQHKLTR